MRTPTIVFSWIVKIACQHIIPWPATNISVLLHQRYCRLFIHYLNHNQSMVLLDDQPSVLFILLHMLYLKMDVCKRFFSFNMKWAAFTHLPQEIQNRIKGSYIYVCKYQHIHHICINIILHVHVCHMKSRPVFFRRRCCFALYRCDREY